MIKNKKGAIQFSFAWIFAIIAGAFILFLAIYGVAKFMDLNDDSQNAETALDLGILTNPLESSFESSRRTTLSLSSETRIYLGCRKDNSFGRQTIGISQENFNKWSDKGVDVGFPNKYIFANNPVEGKKFYLFSKPFEFPFKIADLIYLTSTKDKYCFIDAPKEIEEEITNLRGKSPSSDENFFIKNCSSASINICFQGGSDCDIKVYPNLNYVEKEGDKLYYEGDALMYAAIFSDKEDYECQLNRLMQRLSKLLNIYLGKSSFLFTRLNCESGIDIELNQLNNLAKNFEDSNELNGMNNLATTIEDRSKYYGECRLW